MAPAAYFIRRQGDECSIVKLHADGREEVTESGLTPADAETLYFLCIGEPVRYEDEAPEDNPEPVERRRPRQLAFKF
jgi:hypothetical protein